MDPRESSEKNVATGCLQFYDSVTREPKHDALLLCFRDWVSMGIERSLGSGEPPHPPPVVASEAIVTLGKWVLVGSGRGRGGGAGSVEHTAHKLMQLHTYTYK